MAGEEARSCTRFEGKRWHRPPEDVVPETIFHHQVGSLTRKLPLPTGEIREECSSVHGCVVWDVQFCMP